MIKAEHSPVASPSLSLGIQDFLHRAKPPLLSMTPSAIQHNNQWGERLLTLLVHSQQDFKKETDTGKDCMNLITIFTNLWLMLTLIAYCKTVNKAKISTLPVALASLPRQASQKWSKGPDKKTETYSSVQITWLSM